MRDVYGLRLGEALVVERFAPLLRQLNQLARTSALRDAADKDLLERFARQRDQEAFAALVRRHGPMVLGVCRSVLRHEQDAEDACQATFLVLARKAGALRRPEAVGPWLHGVAYRLALHARSALRRSEARAAPGEVGPDVDPAAELIAREGQALLHEELVRLPAWYRDPLVLCYLQGATRDEAAQQLGCPVATLKSRLERGRQLLRTRLARRGLTLPAALTGLLLSEVASAASVQAEFARTTSAAAIAFAAALGEVPGVSARVLSWAATALTATRWHVAAALVLALLAACGVASLLAGLGGRPGAQSRDASEKHATQPALASGSWSMTQWLGPHGAIHLAVLTIDQKEGKPTITAIKGDDFQWQPGELTVTGRHVRFTLTGASRREERFDGLIDPADPARVLGSLWGGTSRPDRVVLERIPPGPRRTLPRPEQPPAWAKYLEVAGDDNRFIDLEAPAFRAKPAVEQAVLRAAAKAAQERYATEVPKLFRQVVAEQPNSHFGYEAALELIELADRFGPTAGEIEAWLETARTFAATHGPQFEAATVGRSAHALARHAAYADLARRQAVEADRLARAAGMPETHVALFAEYETERAAWASQPKAPPDGSTWQVTVTGRVTDAKGAPIADAEVLVNNMQWAKVHTADDSYKTRTGADGRYTLTLKCQGTFRLHVTRVWAEKRGFLRADNTERHKLLPGQAATIDFTLQPGEVFGGTLQVRPGDGPVHLLSVRGPNVHETVVATNGKPFELTLPAGTYTVELQRGLRKLSWPGLKTGRTDHRLEEPPFLFTPETVGAGFDALWLSMDRNYSHFALKPQVSWTKLRDEYRPRAVQAKSGQELATVLAEMLDHLDDGHVWIEMPDGKVVGTTRKRWTYNGNRQVVLAQLSEATECGPFAVVGKTKPDGFGYFLMTRQSAATPALVAQAVAAIEKLSDTPGFVIDLRVANGGSEPLALEIARLFCAKRVVYAKSRYRNGPDHDAFTDDQPRELSPAKSGQAYLEPVVCLLGPGCVSSGEGFAQMLTALPHVTTVGLPTRGSSGNPGAAEVGETGLLVYFSRWVDLMPDGTPLEGKGVVPQIRVDATPEQYQAADPTLVRGLEILRAKATKGK